MLSINDSYNFALLSKFPTSNTNQYIQANFKYQIAIYSVIYYYLDYL